MTEEQAMSGKAIYDVFFEHGEVRQDFRKVYISLWSGWLGKERLHLLDEVSEEEWSRFNRMLLAAFGAFRMGVVDHSAETVEFPARLEPLLRDHQESMRKDASQFSQFVIPATAIFAGLRSSELRGLRKVDVDLRRAEITVCQRADAWGVIGPPKSAAGHRTIPIPPMLVTALRVWMLKAPKSEHGLMFPSSDGAVRLHSNMLNREYWPLQIAAGLWEPTGKVDEVDKPIVKPRYDFHSLRHAAASTWIKQRVDLKRLTTWLGHASVQTTLDTCGHLLKDETGDAAIAAAVQAEFLA